ncbi:hypothetical protein B0O80DRAFT_449342 [Mortierella sp. GBAus27b]|nr:hypothetical protein B0O80DRAFT_449342 [Mortierella sp. GBAus27b]
MVQWLHCHLQAILWPQGRVSALFLSCVGCIFRVSGKDGQIIAERQGDGGEGCRKQAEWSCHFFWSSFPNASLILFLAWTKSRWAALLCIRPTADRSLFLDGRAFCVVRRLPLVVFCPFFFSNALARRGDEGARGKPN